MPPPVHTKLIYNGSVGTGVHYMAGPPPAGFIWVIIDINAVLVITTAPSVGSLTIIDNEGGILFAASPPSVQRGYLYRWQGRQVLNAGDDLTGEAQGSWQIRITAYELSTP